MGAGKPQSYHTKDVLSNKFHVHVQKPIKTGDSKGQPL